MIDPRSIDPSVYAAAQEAVDKVSSGVPSMIVTLIVNATVSALADLEQDQEARA